MSLIERRRAEVDAKLDSLSNEFAYWKAITTAEGGLGRHNSQVRRLAATIEGALAPLRETLQKPPKNAPDVLADGESWENQILAAHSIWEVFRSKLVLRQNQLFMNKLAACDDLAWECYSPALNLWDPDRKGPPLVYFSATWSPFAVSRDSNFQNEIRASTGTAAALQDDDFQAVLKQLPVPLVSIPWYQVFHLPGALIIAHEVGHVVEFDFGLTAEIQSALDGAGLKHATVWKGWAREMFADVFGCCAMGPSFAGAMIDLNATTVAKVQNEERTSGIYPTRNLRIRLLAEALRRTDHAPAAVRLCNGWEAVYGPMTKMTGFLDELPQVVSALLAGPYRGLTMTSIIKFPSEWCREVKVIGLNAAQNLPLAGHTDPRKLFAAAQWLHENLQSVRDMASAQENLVTQIIVKSTQLERGVRGTGVRGPDLQKKAQEEAKLVQLEAADRQRGVELRKLLFKPLPAEDPPPAAARRGRRKS